MTLLFLFAMLTGGEQLIIRHIANEGVILEHGETRVMIDGLFREDFDDYYFSLTGKNLEDLENARGPFANIDLLLTTHKHADHFRPQSVGDYLRAEPKTLFLGTPQTVADLKSMLSDFDDLKARISVVSLPWYGQEARTLAGVHVRALAMKHGPNRSKVAIQNHSWVVTIGGKNILHLGDAYTDTANYEPFDWEALDIDVALVPFWFFMSKNGTRMVRDVIKPDHIIAIHVERKSVAEFKEEMKKIWPEMIVFQDFLQEARF